MDVCRAGVSWGPVVLEEPGSYQRTWKVPEALKLFPTWSPQSSPSSLASLRWVSLPCTSQSPDLCISHPLFQPCAAFTTMDNSPTGPSPSMFSGGTFNRYS